MNPRAIIVLVVLVPVPYRDPPSSTFPAAPVTIDTTGETIAEPASNVIPFRSVAA